MIIEHYLHGDYEQCCQWIIGFLIQIFDALLFWSGEILTVFAWKNVLLNKIKYTNFTISKKSSNQNNGI